MSADLTLALIGGDTPDGHIGLADLSNIANSLQELSLRIARSCVPSDSLGRPNALVSEMSRLQLSGLSEGSTVLSIRRGSHEMLNIPLENEQTMAERFVSAVEGLAHGSRPSWADDAVAESGTKLIRALRQAAPTAEFRIDGRPPIRVDTRSVDLGAWAERDAHGAREEVVITGKLEAVDLRTARFVVVDDLANSIRLEGVEDAEAVAYLIGERVEARGQGQRGQRGSSLSITRPVLTAAPLPDAWVHHGAEDLERELSKPGPQIDSGIELDDEEYDDLVAFLKS